ncbi:hypothetical protein BSKO_08715 [Bryopsis sp. KO-2023]|nr:hypothetical protein BSKO_08715 [Bryopsis sp. KO-2023]
MGVQRSAFGAVVLLLGLAVVADCGPTFLRVAGKARPFYCLPQGFEKSEVDVFNSEQDDPREAVLVELETDCSNEGNQSFGAVDSVDEGASEAVDGKIAIVVLSDCPFSQFRDSYRAAGAKLFSVMKMGATSVILINANPGQPSTFLSFATPVPTCIMDAANGDALLGELDSDKSVDLIIEPKHLPLHTADMDTSLVDVSFVLVKGVFTLEPPVPAWPATFMDFDQLSSDRVEGQLIKAEMSGSCLVTAEGSDEFRQCQECWKLGSENAANVFKNAVDFRDSVVLFYSESREEEESQRCYPEFHQLAMLAQELGAAGVLFGMGPETRRPQFPGPEQIPGEFKIPAFSVLRSHASALAPASGTEGVIVSIEYDKDDGFPPYLASEGEPRENTVITFEVPQEDGKTTALTCPSGQALFNPDSWDEIDLPALIGRPSGICTYEDGSGCNLSDKTVELASGKILIMYLRDFPFLHDWGQFVELALDADASAVVVVNLNNDIYTLRQSSGASSPVPMFNVDAECGRQIIATAQHSVQLKTRTVPSRDSEGLIVNLALPAGADGVPKTKGSVVLEVLALVDEELLEMKQALPLTSMKYTARGEENFEEGVVEMGQAAFNPIGHRGFRGQVSVAEAIAKCKDHNTDAGLNCDACLSSSPRLKPLHPAASFAGTIVMVRETYTHCLHPRMIVNELESRGARAVVFANDGRYFRTLPILGEAGDEDRAGIPSFNIVALSAEKFKTWIKDGWTLEFEMPLIRRGEADACTSGDCQKIGIVFSNESLELRPRRKKQAALQNSTPSEGKKNKLSAGAQIGIIASVVAFAVICIAILAIVVYRSPYGKRLRSKRYVVFEPETQLNAVNGTKNLPSDAKLEEEAL